MFAKWKAARAEREATAAKIEQDDYLRRLRNSCDTLSGVQHSGSGCRDALGVYEVRAALRRELERQTAN